MGLIMKYYQDRTEEDRNNLNVIINNKHQKLSHMIGSKNLPLKLTDNKGRTIYFEAKDGAWGFQQHDENNNLIYQEGYTGSFQIQKFNDHNELIYWSHGNSYKEYIIIDLIDNFKHSHKKHDARLSQKLGFINLLEKIMWETN
jgi:hypothetical protein